MLTMSKAAKELFDSNTKEQLADRLSRVEAMLADMRKNGQALANESNYSCEHGKSSPEQCNFCLNANEYDESGDR